MKLVAPGTLLALALGLGALAAAAAVAGPAASARDALPAIREVAPRTLHVYSQLEVVLSHDDLLPVGGKAIITLVGRATRADGSTEKVLLSLPAVVSLRGRIVHRVGGDLERAFGRDHVIFEGEVRAVVPVEGGRKIRAARAGVRIDIFPMGITNAITLSLAAASRDPGAVLGVVLGEEDKGLTIKDLTDSGRSRYAGASSLGRLEPGDTLVQVAGKETASAGDLSAALAALPRTSESISFTVLRQGVRVHLALPRPPALAPQVPSWLWQVLAYLLAGGVVLLGFFAPFAGITSFVERRIAGRIQSRIGPNRVGPGGFLQWLADGIKAIQKEDIIPPTSEKFLFRTAPYFVMAGVFLTFVHLPFSSNLIVADLDIGIFYILAVTSIVVIGIILGGWSSNNKWSMLGGFRSAAQMVSYEIPLGLSVLGVAAVAGGLSLNHIVAEQGGYPWEWNLFHNPALTAGFFLFFVSSLAEGNRAPFDLPEAESELVSGYNTEYSGMRFVFFFFAEWGNLYVMAALATLLFLGGWRIPGVDVLTMDTSFWLQILGLAVLMTKVLALVFVIIWIRWTLPRIRIDQMMTMCWKFLIPLTFASFLVTAAWIAFVPEGLQQIVRFALFAGTVVVGLLFLRRVRFNLRSAMARDGRFRRLEY